jgi:hypothetical protein
MIRQVELVEAAAVVAAHEQDLVDRRHIEAGRARGYTAIAVRDGVGEACVAVEVGHRREQHVRAVERDRPADARHRHRLALVEVGFGVVA